MKYTEAKIGDKVILNKKYDSLNKGSEGIVRNIDSRNMCRIEVTKKLGTASLHDCDGHVKNGKGYNVEYSYLDLLESVESEVQIQTLEMDFGDLCSDSIESFLSKR